jgi:cytochrome b561
MSLPTPGTNKLQVLRAVEDGWQAFCRAPWPFLLFQVLVTVILVPFGGLLLAGLVRLKSGELTQLHPVAAGIAVVVGVIGYVIVGLWGVVGITRCAWISLNGQRPSFRDFTRWDGAASGRLFGSVILLAIALAVVGVLAALLNTGLNALNTTLTVIPVIVFGIFYIWFLISQKFLLQLSLFGVKRPVQTIQAGVSGVNPSWWVVLWLAVVESVIHAVAALFSYGGLFVIFPVVICISTAAYRQLFGSQDHTGILSNG